MRAALKRSIVFASFGVVLVFCINHVFREVVAQKSRQFDEFSHSIKEHKKDCNSCHTIPSRNWRVAGTFPNITDYPDHESCVGCHRQQFFAGNRPQICTICHVQASPRGKARLRFPIRRNRQEFRINFPHSVHQDIIASNREDRLLRPSHIVYASFPGEGLLDDDPQFNSCAICHQTIATLPEFAERKPLNIEPLAAPGNESFTATSEFFKDSPNSHASCFSCHYQAQKPVATDCGSCHVLTAAYFESNTISRYSIKFDHQSENHNKKDCTNCHIRITQSADLRSMLGADVPIMTCGGSCHGKDLKSEISKRNASVAKKQEIFQCNYCHTTAIGSYEIPVSHQK